MRSLSILALGAGVAGLLVGAPAWAVVSDTWSRCAVGGFLFCDDFSNPEGWNVHWVCALPAVPDCSLSNGRFEQGVTPTGERFSYLIHRVSAGERYSIAGREIGLDPGTRFVSIGLSYRATAIDLAFVALRDSVVFHLYDGNVLVGKHEHLLACVGDCSCPPATWPDRAWARPCRAEGLQIVPSSPALPDGAQLALGREADPRTWLQLAGAPEPYLEIPLAAPGGLAFDRVWVLSHISATLTGLGTYARALDDLRVGPSRCDPADDLCSTFGSGWTSCGNNQQNTGEDARNCGSDYPCGSRQYAAHRAEGSWACTDRD